ncbi:hypothetical protein [Acinetobacter gerneri]|uniref:hypothetical protein n=1 Tax=Acinetobacter gerneri TaxID=202952 RepID=UPI003A8B1ED9
MNFFKLFSIPFFTLIASASTFAEQTNKEKVLSTVKNYALNTSCMTTFEQSEENNFGHPDTSNIYISYTTLDNVYLGINKYYVLWGGFQGCDISATGENITYSLTEVEYSEVANRYIIKDPNIIVDVDGEDFFTLANISSFESLDEDTYKISLYMFNEHDVDPKTSHLKDNAKPGYYRMLLKRDASAETANSFKVIEKNRFQ